MIAIDDAGAGHAGLKQLMAVRPDIVKLDRALIRDIHTDLARMALVESFVRFARDVGATVCAEGIESLDELAVLADLDVEWGQGFVARPPGGAVDRRSRRSPPRSAGWRSPRASTRCRPSTSRSAPSDRRLVHLSARLAAAAPARTSRARSR